MKRALAALALCVVSASPARADLLYQTHVEVTRDPSASPLPAANERVIELLLSLMVPGGTLDTTEIVSETQHRTLFSKVTPITPGAAIIVQGPDGAIVIDRTNRRYWKLPANAAPIPFGEYATAAMEATDDHETIAGLDARRFILKTELTRTDGVHVTATNAIIDAWLTEQFAQYSPAGRSSAASAPVTVDRPRGFPLRTVIHGGAFGPWQIVSTVKQLREVPHQDDAFAVPPEFVEVPSPPPNLAAAISLPGSGGYTAGNGVVNPQVIELAKPKYTAQAMRQRIQGTARVSAVVMPDGTLTDVRIVRSLDATYGLDDEAIASVKASRFKPGTRNGVPVAVMITIDVEFAVRDTPQTPAR